MTRIEAPFTPEQVEGLNRYQKRGYFHPFTCGNWNPYGDDSLNAHRAYQTEHGGDLGQLVATIDGWICPVCDYRQDWAWLEMVLPKECADDIGCL